MVKFNQVKKNRMYQSMTTPDEEVMKVVAKLPDRVVYEMCDLYGNPTATMKRSEWQPERWQLLEGISYSGPSLSDL